jgi:hypothetical protein
MICPKCKQETPSILDYCNFCKADLKEYHLKRDENLQSKGSKIFLGVSFLSAIGSFLVTVGLIYGFMNGWIVYSHSTGMLIYLAAPVFFVGSLSSFLATLFSKKTWKKPNKLEE